MFSVPFKQSYWAVKYEAAISNTIIHGKCKSVFWQMKSPYVYLNHLCNESLRTDYRVLYIVPTEASKKGKQTE